MVEQLKRIAEDFGFTFYGMWGMPGGWNWIWYEQYNNHSFRIQIKMDEKSQVYKKVKLEIINVFKSNNYTLFREENLNPDHGYRENLYFKDNE